MEKSLLIRAEALTSLRSKVSDHLILDWLVIQQAGLEEFRITDLEEILNVSNKCAKHKIFGLKMAGLAVANRKELRRMVYRVVTRKGVRISKAGTNKNART